MIQQRKSLFKPVLAVLAAGMLTLCLTGCVISPRRIVDNNGTPSPTPTDTPTATPTPTATATPTPVVAGGAKVDSANVAGAAMGSSTGSPSPLPTDQPVPNRVPEFLFVADAASSSLHAFRIAGDGSLSHLTGSPFPVGDKPQRLLSSGDSLIVAGSASILVFQVDKTSGALRQTDSLGMNSPQMLFDSISHILEISTNGETLKYRLVAGHLHPLGSSPVSPQSQAFLQSPVTFSGVIPVIAGESTVVDATHSFAYALNPNAAQVNAFKLGNDKKLVPLSPASYPAGNGAVSIAVVAP